MSELLGIWLTKIRDEIVVESFFAEVDTNALEYIVIVFAREGLIQSASAI